MGPVPTMAVSQMLWEVGGVGWAALPCGLEQKIRVHITAQIALLPAHVSFILN